MIAAITILFAFPVAAIVAGGIVGVRLSLWHDPDLALATAPDAVAIVAETARRIEAGATRAYVRGRVHVSGDDLEIRDGTGIALARRAELQVFERVRVGLRRVPALSEGDEVVVTGPAIRAPDVDRGFRTVVPTISFVAGTNDPVLALRTARSEA